jgi:hypothetical protein
MPNGIDGVQQINPTAVGGEFWYIGTEPHMDPRFNCPDIMGNMTDGYMCAIDPAVMSVETSMGYNQGSVRKNVNHGFIASVGFMYRSNDWRDVEMTGYFNCTEVTNSACRIQMFARGAELKDERQWCPGSFYMGELTMDGQFRWVKGQYYLSCIAQDWIEAAKIGLGEDLIHRVNSDGWFGIKIVMSNRDIGDGRNGVELHLYLDKGNTNTWVLVGSADYIDSGGWGQDDGFCEGDPDQIITWGGPLATFRLEAGGSQVMFKKLSVREIDLGGEFIAPVPTASAITAASGVFNKVIGLVTLRYRVGMFEIPTCTGEIPTDPDPPPPPPGDPNNPPPTGSLFVEMRFAHKFTIVRASTTITSIDEIMSEMRARAIATANVSGINFGPNFPF